MQPIIDFITTNNSGLTGMLGFLIGTLVGHHIALARDKRSEFNAAVTPIRTQLIKDIEDTRWFVKVPDAVQMDAIEHLMWPWRRKALRTAVERYAAEHQAQERADEIGGRFYDDTNAVRQAAKEVLALLSHR
jgi:hypothetical protein